jgi:hypothetical protein
MDALTYLISRQLRLGGCEPCDLWRSSYLPKSLAYIPFDLDTANEVNRAWAWTINKKVHLIEYGYLVNGTHFAGEHDHNELDHKAIRLNATLNQPGRARWMTTLHELAHYRAHNHLLHEFGLELIEVGKFVDHMFGVI